MQLLNTLQILAASSPLLLGAGPLGYYNSGAGASPVHHQSVNALKLNLRYRQQQKAQQMKKANGNTVTGPALGALGRLSNKALMLLHIQSQWWPNGRDR